MLRFGRRRHQPRVISLADGMLLRSGLELPAASSSRKRKADEKEQKQPRKRLMTGRDDNDDDEKHGVSVQSVRTALGALLLLDADQTASLWQAMSADQAYWFGSELLYLLQPALSRPDEENKERDIYIFSSGNAVATWFTDAGFLREQAYTGPQDVMFSRGSTCVVVCTHPIKTGLSQYDDIHLDANQTDLPFVDMTLHLTRDFDKTIMQLWKYIRHNDISPSFKQKWSYKLFQSRYYSDGEYRHVYFNDHYMCTQWRPRPGHNAFRSGLFFMNDHTSPDDLNEEEPPRFTLATWFDLFERPLCKDPADFPAYLLSSSHPAINWCEK